MITKIIEVAIKAFYLNEQSKIAQVSYGSRKMKVKNLIELLERLDPEIEVRSINKGISKPIRYVRVIEKVSTDERQVLIY